MIGLLLFLFFIALVIGIFALIKGSIKILKIPNRKTALIVIVASFILLIFTASMLDGPEEAAGKSNIGEPELEEEITDETDTNEGNEGNEGNEAEEEIVEDEPVEEEVEPEPEPQPIPEAISYSGTGDDVIIIEKPEEGPVVLYVKANSEGRHFSITGYDDNDNRTNLFVNTTDPYEGITLDASGTTALLEISGQGAWEIESRSMRSLRVLDAPGTIEGSGDDLVQVAGNSSLAAIKGNAEGRHFSVKGYNPSPSLMVNTTDSYEGTVRVAKDTFLLEITAVGDWSVNME